MPFAKGRFFSILQLLKRLFDVDKTYRMNCVPGIYRLCNTQLDELTADAFILFLECLRKYVFQNVLL